MKAKNQKELVRELCENLSATVQSKIDDGKIPEEWDGNELRQYISDLVTWHKMDKKRAREYRNTVIINNL